MPTSLLQLLRYEAAEQAAGAGQRGQRCGISGERHNLPQHQLVHQETWMVFSGGGVMCKGAVLQAAGGSERASGGGGGKAVSTSC